MSGEIVKLKNGLKFMILDRQELDGERYLFLASVTENIEYIYARIVEENVIEPVEDGEIILKLTELVSKKILKDAK